MIDKPSRRARRGRDARCAAPCTPLLSIQAVADLLGVSTKTVRRLIAGGDLAAHRIGGSLRISEEDLRAYLSRCR